MKFRLLFVACLAFSALSISSSRMIAAGAAKAGIVGRYEPPGTTTSYLEFKPNGTCILCLLGDKTTLHYTVQGDNVRLIAPGRPPLVLQIANGVLTMQGAQWTRVGDSPPAAAPKPATPAASGPVSVVAGRYGVPGATEVSFALRPNGTSIELMGPIPEKANYTVQGNIITVTPPNSLSTVYEFDYGILVDPEGPKWVREDYVAPAPGPANADGKAGRYVSGKNLSAHIDIRPDGTFTLMRESRTISGTYALKGDDVALTSPDAKPETFQAGNGILTDPEGVTWKRIWEAAPPPTDAEIAANAVVGERAACYDTIQRLCISSQVWAEAHHGDFEADPKQILAKGYLDGDTDYLHCPLLHDDDEIGYEYFGKGLRYKKGPQEKILFLSKWSDSQGRRMIGRADGHIEFGVPKADDMPKDRRAEFEASVAAAGPGAPATAPAAAPPAPATIAPAAPAPAASAATVPPPPAPVPTLPAPLNPNPLPRPVVQTPVAPPAAAVAPPPVPAAAPITLTSVVAGRRYGASFPESQMPPNPQGYFWVVDRPGGDSKVSDLHHNDWHVANIPGTYKIHIEYRFGAVARTMSNVVEVIVPGR